MLSVSEDPRDVPWDAEGLGNGTLQDTEVDPSYFSLEN